MDDFVKNNQTTSNGQTRPPGSFNMPIPPPPIPPSTQAMFKQDKLKKKTNYKSIGLIVLVLFFLVTTLIVSGLLLTKPKKDTAESYPASTNQNQPTQTQKLVQPQKISDIPVDTFIEKSDTVWVGSNTHGLYRLNENGLTSLIDNIGVHAILPQDNGNAYVGFVSSSGEAVTEYTDDSGIKMTFDSPVFIEGIEKNGLGQYIKTGFSELWTEQGVWSLAEDEQNNIYFSTNYGVYQYANNQIKPIGINDILCYGLLYLNQKLYVGTLGGIWEYSHGQWNQSLNISQDKILQFYPSADGSIYAVSNKGLYRSLDGSSWSQIGSELSLYYVVVLPNQQVLVGGPNGLYEFKDNEFKQLTSLKSVRAIFWKNNILYIGNNKGLWKLDYKL